MSCSTRMVQSSNITQTRVQWNKLNAQLSCRIQSGECPVNYQQSIQTSQLRRDKLTPALRDNAAVFKNAPTADIANSSAMTATPRTRKEQNQQPDDRFPAESASQPVSY